MHKEIGISISFYKFVNISNLDDVRAKIKSCLYNLGILGTVILAKEGINANFCGSEKNIFIAKKFITKLLSLKFIHYNESRIKSKTFTKLKVKVKKEIIKAGFSLSEDMIDHKKKLDPLEWDKLLDENPVVIDMRNRFEYHMGTFKDSKSLDLINFSDIKEVLKSNNDIDKKKDIAIFCTGGIRCEKAAFILKDLGFNNIFQLNGGIINYLENNKDSRKWDGECFVFDDRITL